MKFPGKILWFGEHIVLLGSKALAGPLIVFSGSWKKNGSPEQQESLRQWLIWLQEKQSNGELSVYYRLDAFSSDLNEGLFFESNIPIGYGGGSSGALCAAFYSVYAHQPISGMDQTQWPALRQQLSEIEAFFHGSSSGTDPLICYLQQPLVLQNNGSISPVYLPPLPGPLRFFLIDTGIPRSTSPYVDAFLQVSKDEGFRQKKLPHLMSASDQALTAWLNGYFEDLFPAFSLLSRLQRNYLDFLIPEEFQDFWDKTLSTPHTRLKLCGAGGGGFILGLTRHPAPGESFFSPAPIIWI